MNKGQPGQRYILGNTNVTLMQLFAMLGAITGLRPPRWRVPLWLVTVAGYLDQMVEGDLMGREPRIPLEGIKAAKHPMYVNCAKAVDELGMPQSPVEEALANAVNWFTEFGYLNRKAA